MRKVLYIIIPGYIKYNYFLNLHNDVSIFISGWREAIMVVAYLLNIPTQEFH